MDVHELTRPEIEDIGRMGPYAVGRAITQLLAQLDAANAKIALHERENVTRGMLIDQLEAGAVAAAADVAQAARDVIARWDTPSWKDAPATAIVIEKLRAALHAIADGALVDRDGA